jgi:hypothetical protein
MEPLADDTTDLDRLRRDLVQGIAAVTDIRVLQVLEKTLQASIMAPATPFCFWTTQKHLTIERTMGLRI